MEASQRKILSEQEYAVSGKTQTRIDTRFSENEFSCVVKYTDLKSRKVRFEIKDFQQTSTAMTDTMGADLSGAINKLLFQLGDRDELRAILNTREIEETWKTSKPQLLEKYEDIPDLEPLLDNYADNLKDTEKLLAAIRDKGVYSLFFPRVKHLVRGELPVQFKRTKIIKEFMPSIDLPVREMISVEDQGGKIIVKITGELNEEVFDAPKYLELSRRLFGEQIKAEDTSFQSTETYSLNGFTLEYKTGAQHLRFETKGAFFKDDRMEFRLKD